MKGESRPELRAVPGAEGAESAETAGVPESPPRGARQESADAPRRGSWWLLGLLGVALLVVFLGYLSQRQRAETLAGEVAALQGRLQEAEQSLQAAEARMERVRGHVAALADRFALLQREVAEPGPEAGSPDAGEPPASDEQSPSDDQPASAEQPASE